MDLGEAGEKKIKSWEGLARWANAIQRFIVYLDQAGRQTIGWGHLLTPEEIRNGRYAKGLVQWECDELFNIDVRRYVDAVNACIKVALGQHQFDALCVLAYNIGTAGIASSSAVRLINAKAGDKAIADAWCLWRKRIDPKTGLKVDDAGLLNRRRDELTLFFDPEAIHDTPTPSEVERHKAMEIASPELTEEEKAWAAGKVAGSLSELGREAVDEDWREEKTDPQTPKSKPPGPSA